jgi:F-type H+-transporting ATPase subunit epsilon
VALLEVHVIAPERRLWRGAATSVSAPAAGGEIGILPQHAPLLSLLREGTVRVHPDGGDTREFHVDRGVISVDSDVVTVLIETGRAPAGR